MMRLPTNRLYNLKFFLELSVNFSSSAAAETLATAKIVANNNLWIHMISRSSIDDGAVCKFGEVAYGATGGYDAWQLPSLALKEGYLAERRVESESQFIWECCAPVKKRTFAARCLAQTVWQQTAKETNYSKKNISVILASILKPKIFELKLGIPKLGAKASERNAEQWVGPVVLKQIRNKFGNAIISERAN